MSGGSMDYFCDKLENAADHFRLHNPERIALREHLLKLAKALRAVEWNDSGDGDDEESELIRAVLAPQAILAAAIETAERAHQQLADELRRAKERKP